MKKWKMTEFADEVVTPALKAIDLFSPQAGVLVLGTALAESGLRAVRQIGGGPALGYFQMEPATHDDIWRNFLQYKGDLYRKIAAAFPNVKPRRPPMIVAEGTKTHSPTFLDVPHWSELETNHQYAAAMCRVHYFRVKEPLPANSKDIAAMAQYWKRYYNTEQGKGTVAHFLDAWGVGVMDNL